MFDGPSFPKSLDEEVFIQWLEKGRQSMIGYHFLLVIWDEYEKAYRPIYAEQRDEISDYKTDRAEAGREWLVAVYDLYSESRIV
jgi:hypothetical protein